MNRPQDPGAPSAGVRRPSPRTSYPDLSFRFRPAASRITREISTGRRYQIRLLAQRTDGLCRYELSTSGQPSFVVTDRGDYAECGCREFDSNLECVHTRVLEGLGLVQPVRFVLTSDDRGGRR